MSRKDTWITVLAVCVPFGLLGLVFAYAWVTTMPGLP
jgi:hypothetical protein